MIRLCVRFATFLWNKVPTLSSLVTQLFLLFDISFVFAQVLCSLPFPYVPMSVRCFVYDISITVLDIEINPKLFLTYMLQGLSVLEEQDADNHMLTLKLGVHVMLLRNINHQRGLCNGTHMVITKLKEHVIEGKIISGSHAGKYAYLPRMRPMPSFRKRYCEECNQCLHLEKDIVKAKDGLTYSI
ncbi:ATP-dependent DNA helicase PIF1-like protein, partial [Tanacetum coccineum]